jgi:biotin-(acetyl-CoA carboxylase) ligase
VAWAGGEGTARGVDEEGRLLVERGEFVQALNAGEVRLKSPPSAGP